MIVHGADKFFRAPFSDENVPTLTTQSAKGETFSTFANRLSQPFQEVMQAGLIQEGQIVLLDYGPRGKPKKQWKGILRKDGVEIDGKIMSLSAAAVYCIKKAGSHRETANGWNRWKTEEGTYLNEFLNKIFLSSSTDPEIKTGRRSGSTNTQIALNAP